MSKMYKDAVIEANRLRELAEQNAKNKIIEAVAPRIRRLIEQELLDDEMVDLDDELLDDEMEPIPADADAGYEMPDVEPALAPEDDAVLTATLTPDEMGAPADDLVGDELMDDELPLDAMDDGLGGAAPTEFSFEKDGKQVKVSVTVEGSKSNKVLDVSPDVLKRFGGSQYQLKKNSLGFLVTRLNEAKTAKKKRAVLKEILKIRKRLIVMTEAGDASSRKKLKALDFLLKESMKMSRRKTRRSRRLTERAWWLMEQDDIEGGGDELDGLDDELGDMEEEEGDDEMVPKSDVAVAVADVLGVDPDELQDLVDGGGDEEDLEGEDEFELEDEDLEEWGLREAEEDEKEEEEEEEEEEKEEIVEISEAMLRREIARMSRNRKVAARRRRPSRRMSESARRRRAALRRRRRLQEQGPMDGSGASSFGDGTAGQEPFIEVSEEALLNALAEELGEQNDAPGDANKGQSAFGDASPAGAVDLDGTNLATESRRRAARRRAAARRRPTSRRAQVAEAAARKNARRAQLAERKAKAVRKELKESNLFNAKLLYVNKLMQSYDLNTKQQRAIVEALDNAKTLREAKLLYTSLTESLRKRRTSGSGRISEGALRTGSASKSTRSAAPAKSGMELDRWAVLAGINKPE